MNWQTCLDQITGDDPGVYYPDMVLPRAKEAATWPVYKILRVQLATHARLYTEDPHTTDQVNCLYEEPYN